MSRPNNHIIALTREGIEAAGGLDPRRKVGVALSGGADSVALLSLLTTLKYDCVALHCNFHLRGDESDRDERHVRELTAKMGVPLEVAQMDVGARREMTSESIEMACRELRYRWFETMANRLDLQAIAVAHHRDDQIETFFLNLLRGSGVKGLAAMKPRNGLTIRPLLEITRSQITEYLTQKGLRWVTDSTNASDEYKRNRLRNRLIPHLNELFPGASEAISRTINNLRKQAGLLDETVKQRRGMYADENGVIDLQRIINEEECASELIYEILLSEGFNASTVNDIIASADKTGLTFNAKERKYVLERGKLSPLSADNADRGGVFSHPGDLPGIVTETVERESLTTLRCDNNTLLLDADAVAGEHRWELRHWREGDRMAPFGMRGTRLVSDIFTDAKMSFAERRRQRVVTIDGDIVWLPGLRASRHYAVTEGTKTVMRLINLSD